MTTVELHKYLSKCWLAKGKQEFALAHHKRAAAIVFGAKPSKAESDMDMVVVMAETCGALTTT